MYPNDFFSNNRNCIKIISGLPSFEVWEIDTRREEKIVKNEIYTTLPITVESDLQYREDQPFLVNKDFDILSNLSQINAFADCVESLRLKRYEVCIPENIKRLIAEGKASWDNYGDSYGALIRNCENGQIIKQIRVKELPDNFLEIILPKL